MRNSEASTKRVLTGSTIIMLAAALALGALLVTMFGGVFGFLKNPFETKKVDRTGPAMLTAVQNLARIEGSSGTFQVVVDIQEDAQYLPAALKGQRIIYLAQGSASGTVELGGLDASKMTIDETTKTVTFRVPKAAINNVRIDPKVSRVLSYKRGILDRIGGALGGLDPLPQELNVLAEKQLTEAAKASELRQRAEASTRSVLQSIASGLGYKNVSVVFE